MKKSDSLVVGKYFLIPKGDGFEYQGIILGEKNDWLLIQLFSWIDGRPTDQYVVSFEKCKLWLLYDSEEDMTEAIRRNGFMKKEV